MPNLVQDHLACLQRCEKPQGDRVTYRAHSDNTDRVIVGLTVHVMPVPHQHHSGGQHTRK